MNYFDILKRIARALESIDESLKEAVGLLREIKENTSQSSFPEIWDD